MSLVAELDNPASPLREFFRTHLPHDRDLRDRWRTLATPTAELPPPDGQVTTLGRSRRYPYDEVGTAVGIRLGLLFTPALPTPALPPTRHPRTHASMPAWEALTDQLARAAESGAGFTPGTAPEEERLARLSYVAGLFDQLYRIGARPGMPLLEADPGWDADRLLAELPAPACVADIVALTATGRAALAPLAGASPVHVSPTFAGSAHLGGADADLIAGGTLLEVKTVKRATLEARHAQQLVAYALLDYDDRYQLTDLGFYLSRHGAYATVPLGEALRLVAGRDVHPGELREQLQAVLAAPYRRPRHR